MKIINFLGRFLLKTTRTALMIMMVMTAALYLVLFLIELFVWQWPVFFAIVFLAVFQQILISVYEGISASQDRFPT